MGPSGSGKSTLLYILGALDPPIVRHRHARRHGPVRARRARAGGVSQRAHRLRVPGPLAAAAVLGARERADARRWSRPPAQQDGGGREARPRDPRRRSGLGSRLDHRPGELSGGEKQRAAIARALIRNPTLLLCDEPTGNLDASIADSVADLLLDLHAAHNTILVVVTHSAGPGGAIPGALPHGGPRAGRRLTMSLFRLALRSATYYWRTNLAVLLGVGAAVAVLGGALLVGDSVRGSLRDIALGRLGKTDQALVVRRSSSAKRLADEHRARRRLAAGAAHRRDRLRHPRAVRQPRRRRRRLRRRRALLDVSRRAAAGGSRDLAGAGRGARRSKPATCSWCGCSGRPRSRSSRCSGARRRSAARSALTLSEVLTRERLGEFSLRPQQAELRAVFAPLRRVQRDLGVQDRVNTVLIAGAGRRGGAATPSRARADARGSRHQRQAVGGWHAGHRRHHQRHPQPVPRRRASATPARSSGSHELPVFTYLANTMRVGDRSVPYSLIAATRSRARAARARRTRTCAPTPARQHQHRCRSS